MSYFNNICLSIDWQVKIQIPQNNKKVFEFKNDEKIKKIVLHLKFVTNYIICFI